MPAAAASASAAAARAWSASSSRRALRWTCMLRACVCVCLRLRASVFVSFYVCVCLRTRVYACVRVYLCPRVRVRGCQAPACWRGRARIRPGGKGECACVLAIARACGFASVHTRALCVRASVRGGRAGGGGVGGLGVGRERGLPRPSSARIRGTPAPPAAARRRRPAPGPDRPSPARGAAPRPTGGGRRPRPARRRAARPPAAAPASWTRTRPSRRRRRRRRRCRSRRRHSKQMLLGCYCSVRRVRRRCRRSTAPCDGSQWGLRGGRPGRRRQGMTKQAGFQRNILLIGRALRRRLLKRAMASLREGMSRRRCRSGPESGVQEMAPRLLEMKASTLRRAIRGATQRAVPGLLDSPEIGWDD